MANPPKTDVLESGSLRIVVNRVGAELVSVARRDGDGNFRGMLYRDGELSAPSTGWGNHATVMGYFLHRLVGERSWYRGKEISGGNHGFIRHFAFGEPERTANSLTYRVAASEVPPEAYPLRVSFAISYRIEDGALGVHFSFHNEEPELDAHVSFGLHPGFAVGSPLTCGLEMPPGRYIRHFAPGNFLDGRTEVIDWNGGPAPFAREDLPGSYLVELADVPDAKFVLEAAAGAIELDFSGVPYMTLWSDLGPFLCVEPCWGLPDSKPQKPFEEKIGIQQIPPLGNLEAAFRIRPLA